MITFLNENQKHKIPLSSIPCFQYQKELSKEKELLEQQQRQWQGQQKEENPGKEISSINENPSKEMPNVTAIAKVETLAENKKEKSLNHLQVREYCKRLFQFETIAVKKFTLVV